MQQEKDYIQREIQRLSLFLSKLIGKALGISTNDYELEIKKIEKELENEFDLSLSTILEMQDSEFNIRIASLHEAHLEKLAELLIILSQKEIKRKDFMKNKASLILDYLHANSKTFSFKRMELRKKL